MKKFIIKLIKNYQKNISPNTSKKCRYEPTCSQYALESFERFNIFYASFLAIKRILKCNPLFKGGYNPTPFHRHYKKMKEEIIQKEFKMETYIEQAMNLNNGCQIYSYQNNSWQGVMGSIIDINNSDINERYLYIYYKNKKSKTIDFIPYFFNKHLSKYKNINYDKQIIFDITLSENKKEKIINIYIPINKDIS